MLQNYLPIVILLAVCGIVGVALLVLARAIGPSRPSAEKGLPYESGLDPAGTPRIRFNAQFYRIALLFLVFDIEAAFFYPWAVLFRELSCKGPLQSGVCQAGTTPFGLLVMLVFMLVLVLALVFVWRKRALEWD